MDKELEQFKADLLQSVRQMRAGKGARSIQVALQPVSEARIKVGLAQADFAKLLGVSLRCQTHLEFEPLRAGLRKVNLNQ